MGRAARTTQGKGFLGEFRTGGKDGEVWDKVNNRIIELVVVDRQIEVEQWEF